MSGTDWAGLAPENALCANGQVRICFSGLDTLPFLSSYVCQKANANRVDFKRTEPQVKAFEKVSQRKSV
jgi:hypothetical protein